MQLRDEGAEAVAEGPGEAGQGNKALSVHSGPGHLYLIAAKRRRLDTPRERLSREISRFL